MKQKRHDRFIMLFILMIVTSLGYLFLNPEVTIIGLLVAILLNQVYPI